MRAAGTKAKGKRSNQYCCFKRCWSLWLLQSANISYAESTPFANVVLLTYSSFVHRLKLLYRESNGKEAPTSSSRYMASIFGSDCLYQQRLRRLLPRDFRRRRLPRNCQRTPSATRSCTRPVPGSISDRTWLVGRPVQTAPVCPY